MESTRTEVGIIKIDPEFQPIDEFKALKYLGIPTDGKIIIKWEYEEDVK